MANKELLGDGTLLGIALELCGAVMIFGVVTVSLIFGVTTIETGVLLVAAVFSAAGVTGITVEYVALSGRLSHVDHTRARSGGLACILATLLLTFPSPGTSLPLEPIWLVGGAVCGVSGVLIVGRLVWTVWIER
jgi:hypothetical protein